MTLSRRYTLSYMPNKQMKLGKPVGEHMAYVSTLPARCEADENLTSNLRKEVREKFHEQGWVLNDIKELGAWEVWNKI